MLVGAQPHHQIDTATQERTPPRACWTRVAARPEVNGPGASPLSTSAGQPYRVLQDGSIELRAPSGHSILIDASDLDRVGRFRWRVMAFKGVYYAGRRSKVGGVHWVHLARFLLEAPADRLVDHANRTPLDNRRRNLRLATVGQNNINRASVPGKSGYRGVRRVTKRGRVGFVTRLWFERKLYCKGPYKTAEQAARAYDDLAIKFHGQFAVLNFPELAQ